MFVLAGLAAALINGVAGGGTLISFPVLLALGYPAIVANITSTIGIWPGYAASTAGFRGELSTQRRRLLTLAPITVVGAIGGAVLLLTTPSSVFSRITPWLVLGATLLFASGPLVRRWLAARGRTVRTQPVPLAVGILLSSLYGGYFGAGVGVIILAVLGLTLPDTLLRSTSLRAVLSGTANGVAALVFIVHGSIRWDTVGLIALGALVGGYVGSFLAKRLPSGTLRAVVVAVGITTSVKLLVG
ncbi:MAG: sulfite exporter TauE/SafE family protein [Acidimicrobiales bacterium]